MSPDIYSARESGQDLASPDLKYFSPAQPLLLAQPAIQSFVKPNGKLNFKFAGTSIHAAWFRDFSKPADRTSTGKADHLCLWRIARNPPLAVQVNPRRSTALNRHWHINPEVIARMSFNEIRSSGEGHLTRSFLVMPDGIVHALDQLPAHIIDVVIRMLPPRGVVAFTASL